MGVLSTVTNLRKMNFIKRLYSTNTVESSTTSLLHNLSKLMHEVNGNSSISVKRSILKKYPDCHSTLKRIYDPHFRIFLTSKSVKNYMNTAKTPLLSSTPATSFTSLNELLDALASRSIKGRTAQDAIATFYVTYCKTKEQQDVFWRVIDRNLKMGVSFQTLRQMLLTKEHGKAGKEEIVNYNGNNKKKTAKTPFFTVALAHSVSTKKKPLDFNVDTWFASQKLDGIRCITMICYNEKLAKYDIQFYSRTGRPFYSLRKVKENIEQRLSELKVRKSSAKDFVLDGELCAYNDSDVAKEDFLKVLSELRRLNEDMQNPVYQIFDLIQLDHFVQAKSPELFHSRQATLRNFIGDKRLPHINLVEQVKLHSMDQLNQLKENAVKLGWEGLILRKDVEYEGKRTFVSFPIVSCYYDFDTHFPYFAIRRNMLKLKEWEDAEYIVQSVETGFMRMPDTGEDRNVLTNVNILHKGNTVSVGSGFSLSERIKYAEQPNLLIGKLITVRYFTESKREDGLVSLRFPTVKAIYEEGKRDA
ncbi:hypothetical protein BDF20DRAFT_833438 [Mycotypha africana]|uniref:uncharacterized protein n=1 Tax=Mycotypha africana TaxID=64632 RepID=UPI002300FB39|nr:uncharacterized protein BDF20DRAFT_833438 [Mycotypha africana]KAI8988604.1 hypothetical protein BDF20DRAFT_833438 [Mycotypha africana]